MKRKILIITSSLTFALAIVLTITLNTHKNGLSDLALDNVEALANGEVVDGDDGLANACCPIWNVEIETKGVIWPEVTVTCKTGGSYQCNDCQCPNPQ